jgi:hypothetical protein
MYIFYFFVYFLFLCIFFISMYCGVLEYIEVSDDYLLPLLVIVFNLQSNCNVKLTSSQQQLQNVLGSASK